MLYEHEQTQPRAAAREPPSAGTQPGAGADSRSCRRLSPFWLLVPNLSRGSSRSPENGMKTQNPIICDTKGSINSRISGTFIHGRYFWSGELPLKTSCYLRKPAPSARLPTCHLPGLEAPACAPVPSHCALGLQGQTHSRTHQPREGLSAAWC